MAWDTGSWGEVMASAALPIRTVDREESPARAQLRVVANRAAAGSPRPARVPRRKLIQQDFAAVNGDRERLKGELFEAAQIQRKLTGPRYVRRDGLEVAGELFPAGYLSGDFFSTFEVRKRTVFAVGDIAGKGIAAGLWFTHLVSLVRILASRRLQPAQALAAVNRELYLSRPGPPITSIFLGSIDANTGDLEFCNAGHPAPLVLRAGAGMTELRDGGPVLGALATAAFETGHTTLAPGDILLVYTDGLVECRNRAGEEFGAERLISSATSAADKSARGILFSLLGEVQDFAANEERQDDITLMVIRRDDTPRGAPLRKAHGC